MQLCLILHIIFHSQTTHANTHYDIIKMITEDGEEPYDNMQTIG